MADIQNDKIAFLVRFNFFDEADGWLRASSRVCFGEKMDCFGKKTRAMEGMGLRFCNIIFGVVCIGFIFFVFLPPILK